MRCFVRKCSYYILIATLLCVLCFSNTTEVHAKTYIKTKVVKVTNKQKKLRIKVKINNNRKKIIELTDDITIYQKLNEKLIKIDWKENYVIPCSLYIISPKSSVNFTFTINKNQLTKKLKKGKKYKIGIKINGKVHKANFKIKSN